MVDHWTASANCKGRLNEMFPDCETRGPAMRRAKRLCVPCPVRTECLADALHLDDRYGIRGGLASPERKQHQAGAPVRWCPHCGLLFAALDGGGMCVACRPLGRPTPPAVPAVATEPGADPRCGTMRGVGVHQRRGEPPCDPCREASNIYRRDWDRQRRTGLSGDWRELADARGSP